jgi:phosphoribosylformylglycinamidine cyclo-ligase
VVQGAEPLFFLDYLACGKLVPAQIEAIIKGIAEGCKQAGCALIGGETAEMPGMYNEGEYDIAGFVVGAVDRARIIDGRQIAIGDQVIGLLSSGLHSNGYSLVRQVFLTDKGYDLQQVFPELNGQKLGDVLMTPTKIYVKSILALLERFTIKGMAHITGGGFIDNIPRILPEQTAVQINKNSWSIPPIFQLLQQDGKITESDMFRTFNMGIGMVLVVNKNDHLTILQALRELGEEAFLIGEIVSGNGEVLL